jgi:hypothetical protein
MSEPPSIPRVFVEFHNSDPQGRVRLNCAGTKQDLTRLGIVLKEGMRLLLVSYELETEGIALYSATEDLWVAKIDWNNVRDRESNHAAGL